MQTTQTTQTLPIQVQGASATPARGAGMGAGEGFSQALSDSRQALRNLAQSREAGPAPRPMVQDKSGAKPVERPGSADHVAEAAQQAAASGASADVPSAQANGNGAPAQGNAPANEAQAKGDAQAKAEAQAKADADAAAAQAADAAAITPVADMLALVAAFNQPAQAAADPAAAQAATQFDPRALVLSPADAAAAAAAAAALASAPADAARVAPAAAAANVVAQAAGTVVAAGADAAAMAAALAAAPAAAAPAAPAADPALAAGSAAEGAIKLDAAALKAQDAIDPALLDAAKRAAAKQGAPAEASFARQLAQAAAPQARDTRPAEPGLPLDAQMAGPAVADGGQPQSGLKLETVQRSTRTETGAAIPSDKVTADVKPEIKPMAAGVSAAFAQAKPEVALQQGPARTEAVDLSAVREAAPQPATFQQAMPAALQAAHAANVAASDRIPARVGTPGWDNQVTQKVIFMAAGGEQSASLTLNPPDLGPMQVVLSVTNDTTNVTFSAAQPEVRQALESAMPKLREMMSESGISLGNATVNAGMPDQSQAQAQSDQRGGQQQGGGGRFANGANAAPSDQPASRPARRNENGLVDTFA